MKMEKVTVIIPLHNGQSTIADTLSCVFAQKTKIDQLIIIDDNSCDESLKIVKNVIHGKNIKATIIKNKHNIGLANSYNLGIKKVEGNLIVTIHQDVIFDNEALGMLIRPFKDKTVVASSHIVAHPQKVWNEYNFWQKALFSRLLNNEYSGIDGKFDCFKKEALDIIGGFDGITFLKAGEDGDIVHRLKKIGSIAKTNARIIHIHGKDKNFTILKYIYKHAQYAQAQGAMLRKFGVSDFMSFVKAFFREILLATLLIPYIRYLGLVLIILYSIKYTYAMFTKTKIELKTLFLPFINIALLFVSSYYSISGYIYGKEKI